MILNHTGCFQFLKQCSEVSGNWFTELWGNPDAVLFLKYFTINIFPLILLCCHFCISNKQIVVFHSTVETINRKTESWEVIRTSTEEINGIEVNKHFICSV